MEVSSFSPLAAASTLGEQPLDPADRRRLEELRHRDREVRAHEQAHKAAAGTHARGGPTYEYERGPDGRRYAVSGEVKIDTSEVPGNPRATITKMQQVRRAALAPANPSAADRRIAAEASRKEQEARREAAAERGEGSFAPAEGARRYTDVLLFDSSSARLSIRL